MGVLIVVLYRRMAKVPLDPPTTRLILNRYKKDVPPGTAKPLL
jgi:hypothetical protein